MPTFLAPYLPLLYAALAIGLFGSGVSIGVKWEAGEHAKQEVIVANAYLDAARRNAEFESTAALATAKKRAAGQASALKRAHKLELELAKDENARTCRISDGSFSVLVESIDSVNGAAGKAVGVDGTKPAVPEASQPDSGGLGSGIKGWFGRLRGVPNGQAGPDRVDQPR